MNSVVKMGLVAMAMLGILVFVVYTLGSLVSKNPYVGLWIDAFGNRLEMRADYTAVLTARDPQSGVTTEFNLTYEKSSWDDLGITGENKLGKQVVFKCYITAYKGNELLVSQQSLTNEFLAIETPYVPTRIEDSLEDKLKKVAEDAQKRLAIGFKKVR